MVVQDVSCIKADGNHAVHTLLFPEVELRVDSCTGSAAALLAYVCFAGVACRLP